MTKNKSIHALILLITVLLLSDSLRAQVKNSVYSMFGVGEIIDNCFGVNRSLGGTGIAFQSGGSINYINPASYIGIPPNAIILEMGLYGIYNRSENHTTSQSAGDMNLSYMSVGLYLSDFWAFCFGIFPFSNVDYEINSVDDIGGELTTYEKNYTGSGGLNRVNFGNTFKVFKGLSVGFNASYVFGLITQTESAEGDDSFTDYELINERYANSFYMDYGLQCSVHKNDWLYTLGVIYGAGKTLDMTDERVFSYDTTTMDLEQDEQASIRIPQKLGAGFSVNKNDRFRAGFDYEWKNWSDMEFSNPVLVTKNSNRFSLGIEFAPASKDDGAGNIIYRLGANYENSYLEIDHTPLSSFRINVGIGIPVNRINTLNFSLEYCEDGTMKNGLIKNRQLGFYISVSLFEFWRKRGY